MNINTKYYLHVRNLSVYMFKCFTSNLFKTNLVTMFQTLGCELCHEYASLYKNNDLIFRPMFLYNS